MTASRPCHGSSRNSEPSSPTASSSSRAASARPQSSVREHVAGEAQRGHERDVDAVAADHLLGVHALGLGAGQRAAAAHAVAADVHQPAAVEVGAQADVVRVGRR